MFNICLWASTVCFIGATVGFIVALIEINKFEKKLKGKVAVKINSADEFIQFHSIRYRQGFIPIQYGEEHSWTYPMYSAWGNSIEQSQTKERFKDDYFIIDFNQVKRLTRDNE